MLRGKESEDEFLFVENYCENNEITFEGKKTDVLTYQQQFALSTQVAARECRYQFFKEVMEKHNGQFLALAHHGDDQVETMIMRQIRGAYGKGMAGIPVKRPFGQGFIVRPFLCVSKDDIMTYCQKENLQPRIDSSNFSNKYLRNRIRNEVLPVLKIENPSVHTRFQQQSELLLEDELFLEKLAKQMIEETIIKKTANELIIFIPKLKHAPFPLQRRGFQLILNYLYERNLPEIITIHFEQLLNFVNNNHPSGLLNFPNYLTIKKSYDRCIFTFEKNEKATSYELPLDFPGIVQLKKGMIIGEVTAVAPHNGSQNKDTVIFDYEKITKPLLVRNRKQGDYLLLSIGKKKLKSLFIDEKISREDREIWPIVQDGAGEILWIPKLRKSIIAKVTDETKLYLVLTYKEN